MFMLTLALTEAQNINLQRIKAMQVKFNNQPLYKEQIQYIQRLCVYYADSVKSLPPDQTDTQAFRQWFLLKHQMQDKVHVAQSFSFDPSLGYAFILNMEMDGDVSIYLNSLAIENRWSVFLVADSDYKTINQFRVFKNGLYHMNLTEGTYYLVFKSELTQRLYMEISFSYISGLDKVKLNSLLSSFQNIYNNSKTVALMEVVDEMVDYGAADEIQFKFKEVLFFSVSELVLVFLIFYFQVKQFAKITAPQEKK